jgi:signal peptidase I
MIFFFAFASFLVILVYLIFFQNNSITLDGNAMSPTLERGSKVQIEVRPAYKHGDIIVFYHPQNVNEKNTRRIVAVEGETVQIVNGELQVNGFSRSEPYVPAKAEKDTAPVTVPGGHVFVLGDNRNNSIDSRNFGTVPLKNIIGAVKL